MKKLITWWILLTLWIVCIQAKEPGYTTVQDTLHHGKMQMDGAFPVTGIFSYPLFSQDAPSAEAPIGKLNLITQKLLFSPGMQADEAADLRTWFANLTDDYDQVKSDFPDYTTHWMVQRVITLEYAAPPLFTFSMADYWFTGGAHGNSIKLYFHYDIQQDSIIDIDQLFLPGGLDTVTTLAEPVFRRQKAIPHQKSLEDAGFWFKDNTFHLSNSKGLTTEGLVLYYNPYEVACYAEGAIIVVLDWATITPYIRPHYRPSK